MIYYVLMIVSCFTIARSRISLRQLKALNYWVPGCYAGVVYLVIFGTISYIESLEYGTYFASLSEFDISDYFYLLMTGVLTCVQLFLFSKSLSLDNPIRLSIYDYSSLLIYFVFDLTIWGINFNMMQIVGSCIILISNLLVLGKTI